MLHYEAITSQVLELLKRLSGISGFERLRLVEGTSILTNGTGSEYLGWTDCG